MSDFTPTQQTTLKRIPERGRFDHETVYQILDEGLICHIGFESQGQPFVIPTSYGRIEDTLYLHGSSASRMMRQLSKGIRCCITVTLVDGLVLARSAFHHSMNYRSVVMLGTASLVTDPDEKLIGLRQIVDHIVPDRWDQLRPVNDIELKATTLLSMPIRETSAKVRTGPPVDDEEDLSFPVWAGVVPLHLAPGEAISDPDVLESVEMPSYVTPYARPR